VLYSLVRCRHERDGVGTQGSRLFGIGAQKKPVEDAMPELEQALNALRCDGWEIVNLFNRDSIWIGRLRGQGIVVVLKRPKQPACADAPVSYSW